MSKLWVYGYMPRQMTKLFYNAIVLIFLFFSTVSSMLESMWSSMSSSMQLAAECLREEDGPQESHAVEGIEMFAHAIDSSKQILASF